MKAAASLFLFFAFCALASAQSNMVGSTLSGKIVFKESGAPARGAIVAVTQLKRSVVTGEDGTYRFDQVPAGRYELIVHVERAGDAVRTIDIISGANTADLEVSLNAITAQVTVTASGSLENINNSYEAVSTVGAVQLAERNPLSIGEALDNEPGVAKRSFGPASGRPVIRGFDGDRVLILQNGLRVGGISSQSGDEVEPIDVLSLDRVEVVKGPATLLYGSNAIGGVVNGISTNDVYQDGFSGYLTAFGGTNNWQAGSSAGLKYGYKNFMFFGNGTAQKANDYRTPAGTVLNSYARGSSFSGGAGWFPDHGWLSFTYGYDRRRYGIPVEPGEVDFEYLKMHRRNFEVKGGLRDLNSFIEGGDFAVSYNDYRHTEFEFESDENVTEIDSHAFNKNINYRANFNHRRIGKTSGTFGFSGFTRDYESIGEEAPAPRTKQNSFAAYALERVDLEHIGFQFGGRVEQNGYNPEGDLRSRNFIGFSGGAGVRVPLWTGGSFVANYQHSIRAPALEELYNFGPHPGILVFDIGNPNLKAEQGDGIDLSLRHSTDRVRLNVGFFLYSIRNFVYTAFTGEADDESGLPIVDYAQGDGRYLGAEAGADVAIVNTLWFNGKIDYVRAELTVLNKPLPRIPPLRGTIGLDWRYKGFSVRPELILAAKQDRIFDNETPTEGYAVFNAAASYTLIHGRAAHVFTVGGYNLGDKLYRNHLSFVKEIAPEIGRALKATYTLRF
jgi:iron complex outermembrane receptor protein